MTRTRIKFRISEQPDGRWLCDIRGVLPNGEEYRVRRTPKVTSYSAAERWAQQHWNHVLEHGAGGGDTVANYAEQWCKQREAKGISTAKEEKARFKKYVLPEIGKFELTEVRIRHIRELMEKVRQMPINDAGDCLAPRTVRHVYAMLHTMFDEAVTDEIILGNPCNLKKGALPKKVDKNPTWRATAIFTRDEVVRLLNSEMIPGDRRMFYAMLFLTGARFGEVAALRWRHFNSTWQPLGQLIVARSYNTKKLSEKNVKTEVPRGVPVHPTLAKFLKVWHDTAWRKLMDRSPKSTDLIVPSREGRNRNANHMLKRFHEDLERLGMRLRRMHDARRTFITLARADGADKDILEAITHAPRGDIMNVYTTLPWETLCAEVAKLKVSAEPGNLGNFGPASSPAKGANPGLAKCGQSDSLPS